MKITSKNIKEAIEILKRGTNITEPYWILPRCERVLSNRYNKKGRPKNKDYDYVEIDYSYLEKEGYKINGNL